MSDIDWGPTNEDIHERLTKIVMGKVEWDHPKTWSHFITLYQKYGQSCDIGDFFWYIDLLCKNLHVDMIAMNAGEWLEMSMKFETGEIKVKGEFK